MSQEVRTKVCGIDVHKRNLHVCILDRENTCLLKKFENSSTGIRDLITWLHDNECQFIAFESTSIYWKCLYSALKQDSGFTIEVANAKFIKKFDGKKTDDLDSQWIAHLCLNGMIPNSRIVEQPIDELRKITRSRRTLVKMATMLKNVIHRVLDEVQIRLSRILSDIFGKGGRIILKGIVEGTPISEIMKALPSRLREKEELIAAEIMTALSFAQHQTLKSSLSSLNAIEEEIEEMNELIETIVSQNFAEEASILRSIPGIGPILSANIIAEIGPISDFNTPANLVSYAGLNPSIYGSADTLRMGHITKRGNSRLRTSLVEAAHCCVKHKDTFLHHTFLRLEKRIGYKKAIVAISRKILTLIWHLLTNKEYYIDEGLETKEEKVLSTVKQTVETVGLDKITFEEAQNLHKFAVSLLDKIKMREKREIGDITQNPAI